MPALKVVARTHSARATRSREATLAVRLPAAGDALAALLAAVAAPPLSRVSVSVPNARPLSPYEVVGRLAHCRELELLQVRKTHDKELGSESDSEESDSEDSDVSEMRDACILKIAAVARGSRCATARLPAHESWRLP